MTLDRKPLVVAAIAGFSAVALGAFGAHGMKAVWDALPDKAEAVYRGDIWRKAEFYHLTHAIALLAVAAAGVARRFAAASRCWLAGVVLFSGSLYALAFTGVKKLGMITPFGGVLMLAGWIMLMFPKKDA